MTRILAATALILAATHARVDSAVDLDALIAASLEHHPAIAAAEARWRSAEAGARGAGRLPDLQINAGYFVEEVETRVGPQRARVGVRQRIPWFGELGVAREMASLAGGAARDEYAAARLTVVRELKSALAEIWFLEQGGEIVDEQLALLDQVERVTQSRYRSGEASHAQLLRVQVERSRVAERRDELRDAMRPAERRLAAARGLKRSEGHEAPERLPTTPDAETFQADAFAALAGSPSLRGLAARQERAERGVELARKGGAPDFILGLDYIATDPASMEGVAGSGKDPLVLSVGFSVPLWRDHGAAVTEAAARARAGEAALYSETLDLEARLERALFDYRGALRRAELHREELLPAARETAAVSREAYRAGRAGFEDLIETHRLLLELELTLARSEADRYRHHAAAEALAGLGPGKFSPEGATHE